MKRQVLKRTNILLAVLVIMLFSACAKNENPGDQISVDELNSEQMQSAYSLESEEVIDEKSDDSSKKIDIDSLIDSLEVYGNKEPYEKLYSMSTACDNIPDWIGIWNRTNIHSSFSGEIIISDVNSGGFKFTADECYYSHSGWMEGEAKFVTDKCAVAKYEDSIDDDEEYIVFIFENQEMKVFATASSENLGFGMNVSIDGEYTQDEPLYTNANILNETFSEEELSALQANIPEDYYKDFFLFSTTSGVVTDTKFDNGDRNIEVFVPTMAGYGYVLTITNGKDCTITFDDETSFHFSF
ncbi:MAG: hypothetical protein ACI4AD_07645 [Roseburia sp.]